MRKRITLVIPFSGQSGGFDLIDEFAEFLHKNNHSITLAYPLIPHFLKPENRSLIGFFRDWLTRLISNMRVKIFFRDESLKVPVLFVNQLLEASEIIVFTTWSSIYPYRNKVNLLNKSFYWVQGYEIWDGMEDKVTATYRLPVKIFTVSSYLQNKLIPFNQSVKVYLPGINNDLWNSGNIQKEKKIDVLTHDSFLSQKGSELAFQVLNKLVEIYPGLNITVFGYKEYHKNKRFKHTLVLNPTKETLISLYRSSKIFLNCSTDESFALMPLEAMRSGCLVVSTITGAIGQYCKTHYDSILTENTDAESILNSLVNAINLPEETMLKFNENAVQSAKSFDRQKSFSQMETYILS